MFKRSWRSTNVFTESDNEEVLCLDENSNFNRLQESGTSVRSELELRHWSQWIRNILSPTVSGKGKKNRWIIRGTLRDFNSETVYFHWLMDDLWNFEVFFYLMGNLLDVKSNEFIPYSVTWIIFWSLMVKCLISGNWWREVKDLGRKVQDVIYLFRMGLCLMSMNVVQILKIHIGLFIQLCNYPRQ